MTQFWTLYCLRYKKEIITKNITNINKCAIFTMSFFYLETMTFENVCVNYVM